MLAEIQSRDERSVAISQITPAKAADRLCSHCMRPMPSRPVEYVCDECGAWHYVNEFYICCPVDAERPLE
jgi:hypothetical protein